MKNSSYIKLLALVLSATAVSLTFSGCAESATLPPTSNESSQVEESPEEETSVGLIEVQGRAISASDTELILRTADAELTFQIREEDVRAIDPEHIQSHAGIESIGFKVFYRNIDGVDYVVSVEEIDGSTLGFD
jgi:hypothetical protein